MLDKREIETCKQELANYIEFMESARDNAGWARGLKWYINQLETKVKELGKGQHTLMQSRRKWKIRYYKEKRRNKIIDNAINFIQDTCIEEIADMKGCYRETASIGDLQELMNILKGEKEK